MQETSPAFGRHALVVRGQARGSPPCRSRGKRHSIWQHFTGAQGGSAKLQEYRCWRYTRIACTLSKVNTFGYHAGLTTAFFSFFEAISREPIVKPNQLRALVAVADTGGIRGAARVLGLSQAAMTKALRELEGQVGVPLLERTSRGTRLTEYGNALCARARVIMRELERAREDIDQMRGKAGGTLTISVSPIESLTILPAAFEAFRQKFPQVRLTCFEGVLSEALQKLRNGTLDFAVSAAIPERLADEFVWHPLYSSRLQVVARPGHRCADASCLADLAEEEWILNNTREGYSHVLLDAFLREGLPPPTRIIQCHSFLTEIGMVANTDVITILPENMLDIEWVRASVVPIVPGVTFPTVQKSIITRRGVPMSPAAKHLIECLSTEYARRRDAALAPGTALGCASVSAATVLAWTGTPADHAG